MLSSWSMTKREPLPWNTTLSTGVWRELPSGAPESLERGVDVW